MVKKHLFVIIFSLLVMPLLAQSRDKSFDNFWNVFRNAVLKNDFKKLDSLTSFPLIVKGTLDRDPIKRFTRDKFQFIFKHYLKQNNGDLSGTALDDIKRTERVGATDNNAASMKLIRVSDMIFRKINSRWKLYLVYIDTEYQRENNIK